MELALCDGHDTQRGEKKREREVKRESGQEREVKRELESEREHKHTHTHDHDMHSINPLTGRALQTRLAALAEWQLAHAGTLWQRGHRPRCGL